MLREPASEGQESWETGEVLSEGLAILGWAGWAGGPVRSTKSRSSACCGDVSPSADAGTHAPSWRGVGAAPNPEDPQHSSAGKHRAGAERAQLARVQKSSHGTEHGGQGLESQMSGRYFETDPKEAGNFNKRNCFGSCQQATLIKNTTVPQSCGNSPGGRPQLACRQGPQQTLQGPSPSGPGSPHFPRMGCQCRSYFQTRLLVVRAPGRHEGAPPAACRLYVSQHDCNWGPTQTRKLRKMG